MMNTKELRPGVSDGFALGLLKEEQQACPGGNVLLSPLSVSMALAMTLNGSRGKTRSDMALALGFGVGRSRRLINESCAALRDSLADAGDVDLEMANSLVGCPEISFKTNFLNKAKQYFDARIRLLDLQDPSAVVLMNSFICQKTKGKVPAVLEQIEDPDYTQLILLNAVYFHGLFSEPFDCLLTQPEPFKKLDGARSVAALMYQRGSFSYLSEFEFQAVKLPYGQSGRFAFYVFLPRAEGEAGLQSLIELLQDEDHGLSHCFERFCERPGELYLPRFKAEYSSTLNQSLSRLGLEEAFDPKKADFGTLAKSDCTTQITLKHKTVIDVNEEGAVEYAEKQAAVLASRSISAAGAFELRLDRPFYFFIRDEASKSISLAGLINDPA